MPQAAAPFRLGLEARLQVTGGEELLAGGALTEVTHSFARRGAVLEHRLASCDLAALLLGSGETETAIPLARSVSPELAGGWLAAESTDWLSDTGLPEDDPDAEADRPARRAIEESPIFRALSRRDLDPLAGVS